MMRRKHKGQGTIQIIGLLFITLFMGPAAIDTGLYFWQHKVEQNAADAAALAAANELFRNTGANAQAKMTAARAAAKSASQLNYNQQLNDADIEFGYVNPQGVYNADNFLTPTGDAAFTQTGGYNAVRVNVRAAAGQANSQIPSIFGAIFGKTGYNSAAQGVAIYGGGVQGMGGLRPIYMCQSAYNQAVTLYGDPTIPTVRFYGSTLSLTGPAGQTTNVNQGASCGNMGPGNWGLADFDGPGGGQNKVNEYIVNGYPGQVNVGQNYGPKPGNSLNSSSSELQTILNKSIALPLYDSTSGNGANAKFHISMIAGFKVTNFNLQGNNTWVEGKFQKQACTNQCNTSGAVTGGTITRLRMVR